jgi:hypothetical protein
VIVSTQQYDRNLAGASAHNVERLGSITVGQRQIQQDEIDSAFGDTVHPPQQRIGPVHNELDIFARRKP